MSIDLPDYVEEPFRDKLHQVVSKVISILPDDEHPVRAFVSTDTTRSELTYLSVYLFTPKLVVEIRRPLDKERIQYEMFRLKDTVDWIRLNARKYDFETAVEDSQLELEFTTTEGASSVLSANGTGCSDLMEVYKSYFRHNFTGTRD